MGTWRCLGSGLERRGREIRTQTPPSGPNSRSISFQSGPKRGQFERFFVQCATCIPNGLLWPYRQLRLLASHPSMDLVILPARPTTMPCLCPPHRMPKGQNLLWTKASKTRCTRIHLMKSRKAHRQSSVCSFEEAHHIYITQCTICHHRNCSVLGVVRDI